jgi:hypothetical protein
MNDQVKSLLEQASRLGPDERRELAERLLALDVPDDDPIDLAPETLAALDEALAEISRGTLADPAEVAAIFGRARR